LICGDKLEAGATWSLPVIEVRQVQAFWDANPCGSTLSDNQDRIGYFAEIEARRYTHEPHIPHIARFDEFEGERVLEIGTGVGTDGLQFRKNGAQYFGLDLTLAGQRLTQEQFELAGHAGNFTVGNGELLPIADDTFDHIYTFGVIHHSPSTETIVDEMYRVLKPGGTFCVMVYNRSSINYYLEIMFLRKVFRLMLYPGFMPKTLSKILGLDANKLERHRKLLLDRRNISKEEWISMNTDGPECPLAKVYNKTEALRMFKRFTNTRTEVHFFDRTHWPVIGKLIPKAVAIKLGRRWGWHRIVTGQKPEVTHLRSRAN
jgi:ubiquinone/menaquinone biosynthesis C-methylase UbiE